MPPLLTSLSARRGLIWCAAVVLVYVAVTIPMRLIASRPVPGVDVMRGSAATDTLVVAIHGLNGAPSRDGILAIVKEEYPEADVMAPLYFDDKFGVLSNADPYAQVDALEAAIHREFTSRRYEHIILVGHSMGGSLVRKALVWAHGEESDRPGAPRGARTWIEKVDRFVSLAGINRGWTIDPRPDKMKASRAWGIAAGERLAALTGTGRFIRDLKRGAPFVADLRVQWLRVARRTDRFRPPPPTIHLVGTLDDIVNQGDSRDLCAAPGVQFKTLANTGHAEIAAALASERTSDRARTIRDAIAGRLDDFDPPTPEQCPTFPDVERLVFVVHGIRDYADWGEALKQDIEAAANAKGILLKVEPPKYGFFPMVPFLLRPDRQRNVRWFMDQYTDALATHPDVRDVDFIGHSNGTYILGAALVRYRTITIRNAYLAGSVLPQRFPWNRFVPGRVTAVRNVVASEDWVVAIFPRVFEQFAEWGGVESVEGFLDLGAAGFRGFLQSAGGAVRNIKYASGSHGIGVDIADAGRRAAIVTFAVDGLGQPVDLVMDRAFGGAQHPDSRIDLASRVSWLIWTFIIVGVVGLGAALWYVRRWAAIVYVGLLLAVLNSI